MAQRRTQQERTAASRAALINGTIEILAERGLSGFSVDQAAARAGLSRGAHLHHFGTKAALLIATVEEVYDRQVAELGGSLPSPLTLESVLDMAWQMHRGSLYQAVQELYSAARVDAELADRLLHLESRIDAHIAAVARRLPSSYSNRSDLPRLIAMCLSVIRGLAVRVNIHPAEEIDREWAYARTRLCELAQ